MIPKDVREASRDDYYLAEKSRVPGITELIIAKQRNGPTGPVPVMFHAASCTFRTLDAEHWRVWKSK